MGLLLVAAAPALLYWAFLHTAPDRFPFRRTLVSASLAFGLLVLVITELLSVVRGISTTGILAAWLVVDAALLVVVLRLGPPAALGAIARPRLTTTEWIAATAAAAIASLTALIAVLAPPNDWDAMTYHMARVAHWIDNASVAFYPALYMAQLYQGPWSAYATLSVQLATGSDQLVNLVQWVAFVGSATVATLVTAQLGGDRRAQLLTALFVMTVPMAVLQASSAQDHLVVSFWLLSLASLVLAARERLDWRVAVEGGACVGLAILTKSTTYVLAAPFILWALVALARTGGRAAVRRGLLAGVIVVAVNGVHWSRNGEAFGSPFGSTVETGWHVIDGLTPKTFAERLIQESTLQLSLPASMASKAEGFLRSASARVGLDLDDPATIIGSRWSIPPLSTHEDYTGNFVAALVVSGAALVVIARRRRLVLPYLVAVGAAYLLFVALTRWEFYDSRLLLPLFLLAAPVVGVGLAGLSARSAVALSLALTVAAVPWLVRGKARPLVGPANVFTTPRDAQYFVNRPELAEPYARSAEAITRTGCRDVGLTVKGNDPWEYPLWRLLAAAGQGTTLAGVAIDNETRRVVPPRTIHPCAIVAVGLPDDATFIYGGHVYDRSTLAGPVQVYPSSSTAAGHSDGRARSGARPLE